MVTQDKNQMCDTPVRKLTTGEPLDEGEKRHLAVCESCMAVIVATLDEPSANHRKGHSSVANGDISHARPEAKQALEQGRRVIEREFGIKPPKNK